MPSFTHSNDMLWAPKFNKWSNNFDERPHRMPLVRIGLSLSLHAVIDDGMYSNSPHLAIAAMRSKMGEVTMATSIRVSLSSQG